MTHRPSPTLRAYRQRQAVSARSECAELRKRANLAAIMATWKALNTTRPEVPPENIVNPGAKLVHVPE